MYVDTRLKAGKMAKIKNDCHYPLPANAQHRVTLRGEEKTPIKMAKSLTKLLPITKDVGSPQAKNNSIESLVGPITQKPLEKLL